MAEATWRMPGFEIEELLGFGATGEVWRAREVASGERVALKRLRPGMGAEARERLRREAAVLAELHGPHLLRLRAVITDGDSTVLVLDHAAGGSLASLLAVRGGLTPPEVVTVVGPLAQALASLHARGIVHGDVTPANVLFTADGRPLLADLGVARLVGEPVSSVDGVVEFLDPAVLGGSAPSPASDVFALGAVAHTALTGRPPVPGDAGLLGGLAPGAPPALVAAIERALLTDSAGRPSADELSSAVRAACGPAPVGLVRAAAPVMAPLTHAVRVAPAPSTHPSAPTRRRGVHRLPAVARRALTAAIALAAVLGAAALGQAWAARTKPTAHRLAPPAARAAAARPGPEAAPVWRDVLADLDRRRAEAFATLDAGLLQAVYASAAPGLRLDQAALRQLATGRAHARGLRLRLVSVDTVAVTARAATLRVVDRLEPYDVVADDGTLLRHDPGRGRRVFAITLVHERSGWRIADEGSEPAPVK